MSYTLKKIVASVQSVVEERKTLRQGASVRDRVAMVCGSSEAPSTGDAEAKFQQLLSRAKPLPEYGYDALSTWRRGCERALQLSRGVPDFDSVKVALEVACGDGMASVALSSHGIQTVLTDLKDWRDPRAQRLSFTAVDTDGVEPLPGDAVDLVFSYNAFEHFGNPARALKKMLAVTRPGGYLFFEFGPLYAGPWGLHAYRMIPIPYMQFLFSEPFWREKLRATGVRDLGQDLTELQPLNRWSVRQFDQLWRTCGAEVVSSQRFTVERELEIVTQFPTSFQGRGLTYEDLTTQAVQVLLRKPLAAH